MYTVARLTPSFREKKLIVFDLDGTLTESKSDMDAHVSRLLTKLLRVKPVAVVGGGSYGQFQKQFLAKLRAPRALLRNLFLFPATSTSFYRYRGGWRKVYSHFLSPRERKQILKAFAQTFRELHYTHPKRTYGEIIEDRGTQISFSPLGQDVVEHLGGHGVKMKEEWKKKHNSLRLRMRARLARHLPQFTVRVGGLTTIDVTRKGIDKAYGIREIEKRLGVGRKDILFVGDALYPGGNDYAARKTGVACLQVQGPREAKKVIRFLLKK